MTSAEQVVARYQAQYGRIRETTVAQVLGLWRAFGGVGDEDLARFVAAAVAAVEGGQAATAALVAGYISTLARLETGTAPPVAAPKVSVQALRGVSAAEVYARPVITARGALANGKALSEALGLGSQRADHLASTDIALAQRQATLQVISTDERIVGYRRVLTGRSCAFCATASTQRYRRAELAPLHSRCDCGVAPIFGSSDPGQIINRKLVSDLKTAAKQTGQTRKGYWQNRHVVVDEDGTVHLPQVKVRNHGELGPVLTAAGQHFAGPSVAA